jgi:GT2 family glycosyltransferase
VSTTGTHGFEIVDIQSVHAPIAVVEIDLSKPDQEVSIGPAPDGSRFTAISLLVRDGRTPVSWTLLSVPRSGTLKASDLPAELTAGVRSAPTPPSRSSLSVGVGIATCADASTTIGCVRSILASSAPPAEIVVVDNRPANSPVAQALRDAFPNDPVRYVAEERPGLAFARNAGLDVMTTDIVAFTDDDVTVDREWIASIQGAFDADPKVACVTGLILPLELATEPQVDFERFASLGKGLATRTFSTTEPPPDIKLFPYAAGHFGSGANSAFRRAELVALGGFDPLLGTGTRTRGGEDLDVLIRLLTRDHALTYEPAAIVWHRHPPDASGTNRRATDYGIGLGAVIGKLLLDPSHRRRVLKLVPAAIVYWWSPSSRKNSIRGQASSLRTFKYKETLGVAIGPLFYFASRLESARRNRSNRISRIADQAPVPTSAPSAERGFQPIGVGQLELSNRAVPDRLLRKDGTPFEVARLLVRAAGTPVGFVELPTPSGVIDADAAITRALAEYGDQADAEMRDTAWTSATGPKVSVILCTRNRAEGARRTIDSLRALSYDNVEIIVVDNAPDDEATASMVAEVAAVEPRIRYVRESRPGLSCARNRGAAEATGELIAFTDDDVLVDPLWLHGVVRGFNRRPDVACVTGLVASASLERPSEQYFDRRVWWASNLMHRLHTQTPQEGDSALHPYSAGTFGTGANFACRLEILRRIGGFDECLGAGSPTRGGEDLDIFVRLLRAGYALSYEPSSLVWHEHRTNDRSLREQMFGYGVSLGAYMTKYATARASRRAVARRGLSGLIYTVKLFGRAGRAKTSSTASVGLTGAELRGFLLGPAAYRRARSQQTKQHLEAVAP